MFFSHMGHSSSGIDHARGGIWEDTKFIVLEAFGPYPKSHICICVWTQQ